MINGIINVNKGAGFTSFDVVARLRHIFGQKKIGHTGTLDPEATGVLPVCLGNATRVCELLMDETKTYEALMRPGTVTDTQDIWGQILEQNEVTAGFEMIRDVLLSFVGDYEQLPPMYSAKKVAGKKLYELARKGVEVERKPSRVKIFSIADIQMRGDGDVSFSVTCSKGTYIRTLCHDAGVKLGCGACMTALKRTRVGCFELKDALTLEQIEAVELPLLKEHIKTVDVLFEDYPKVMVKTENEKALLNGNPLPLSMTDLSGIGDKTRVRVYDHAGDFKAIYIYLEDEGVFKPHKMFL
ncbi:MAG: tRNA pseudouridine(55) synthase TruB [Lachnospiraceae bacterium]|nr:tRNA pseudouridine(55) synthase TruB [Lachnospiraceae bacterium]